GGRGAGGGRGAARKDRVYEWLPPFGESDTKVLYEADGRITSAEFSPDGKTLFIDQAGAAGQSGDLYAVKLADPSKHYEIAKGATIAAAGRGRGGFGGGRGATPSDSAFYNNPGVLQTTTGPNDLPVVLESSDGHDVFLEGMKYFPDWRSDAPRDFVDEVDIETGAKKRL